MNEWTKALERDYERFYAEVAQLKARYERRQAMRWRILVGVFVLTLVLATLARF